MNYLNKNAREVDKTTFLKRLKLHIVCNSDVSDENVDDELKEEIVLDFLKDLYAKIALSYSDKDWEQLQEQLPFKDLPYSDFDNKEFRDFIIENE